MAVGAQEPLAEHMMVADFFRKSQLELQFDLWKLLTESPDGVDGLGGIHSSVRFHIYSDHFS